MDNPAAAQRSAGGRSWPGLAAGWGNGLGRRLQRPFFCSLACFLTDGGHQGAGPVAADPQLGAEGVAGDGPTGRRTVRGVQFPGPGEQAGREDGKPHRSRLGLAGCGRRADGVDLAQHPGADLLSELSLCDALPGWLIC